MKKTIVWIVVLVVIALVIWFSFGSKKNNVSAETIKIGIIAPLTGTAASYGVEGKNSVVMALDEINAAGGMGGKHVDYFVEDGKCDAKASLDAWNKLVNINKVDFVFGGHCSTETLAIAPQAAKDSVPVFAVFTTAPIVPSEGEWLFRHISTNAYYGTVMAEQAYKKGYRKVALLTEVKDFPVTYSDAFVKAFKDLGGTIVLDERFDPSTKDYRTIVSKLKGLSYDAVFVSTQGADVMGLITNQMRELRLEKAYMYNHAINVNKFLEITKGYMPADYLIVVPFADPQSSKVKAFNEAYVAKYGNAYTFTPFFVTADYDLVHRVKNAVDACGSDGNLKECVRNQFKTATSYSGVAGDVTVSSQYSPKGVLTPVGLLKVTNGVVSIEPVK